MRPNFLKRLGVSAAALTGLGLAASILIAPAHADQWDKMTKLTLDEPTQVSNTYLEPGTYMFVLVTSAPSERHAVQIYTADRSHLINTILAIPAYRANAANDTEISYWETPPGTAKAVRIWRYPGDNYGQEFPYPTNLRQVAAVTAPAPAVAPAPVAELTPPPSADQQAIPAPQAEPPAAPVEIAQTTPLETAPQQAPVEIAQNTTPVNTVPVNTTPDTLAPDTADTSQTLPQTASPYPLLGLGGLISLGLFAALRMNAVA